jgi:hypothetical protein
VPQETITVYVRQSQNITGLGYHSWIVYTNSSGQSYSLSGWSTGHGSILAPFGSIDVQVTQWGPQSWDWPGNNNYANSQLMATGTNLSTAWNNMVQCANQIDFANLPYDPIMANSNSVVNTCLLWAGLSPVSIDTTDPTGSLWTPGSNTDLRTSNLNIKHYFDEPGPPSVQLGFYQGQFGFSGVGERLSGFNSGGSSWSFFSGLSGHWVYAEVGSGGVFSGGFHWVTHYASRIKPVVLDLDGDGVELTSSQASPGFDFFGTGHAKTTGWFTGGDGLLVRDWNANGVVDDGSEISFLHDSPGSTSDLQALAVFDTNQSGTLDSGDAAFDTFRIWRDLNFNGISDSGELQTLAAAGIASIGLQGSGGGYQVNGNDIHAVTTFTRTNATTGSAYDVGFEAFDRGSKLVSQTSQWALLQLDTGETLGVAKPGAAAVTISDLGGYSINGVTPSGLQLTSGNDSVSTGILSQTRAFYVDGGDGNDVINLSASNRSSVIKGGTGDDCLTGTYGSDYFAPGTCMYGDQIFDYGGDEYYILEQGWSYIVDSSGMDVAVMSHYSLNDLTFMVIWDQAVAIGTKDGLLGVQFENMAVSENYGIDYLILEDQTIGYAQIVALANEFFGF